MIDSDKMDKAQEAYEAQGWARIPSVFTQKEVDAIRGAALMALTRGGKNHPYKFGGRLQVENVRGDDWPSIMFWPALVSDYLLEIRNDPRISRLVGYLLGDTNIKQLNNQFYYRLPGGVDAFNWHTDIMFRRNVEKTIAEDYIQTVVVVDAWTEYNGGMAFDALAECVADRSELRKEPTGSFGRLVKASRGDVVVWKVTTPHASMRNTTTMPRMTYMNGFCRARSAPDDWPWYMKDGELVQDIDPDTIPYT